MSELTKEYFEGYLAKALEPFATRKDLEAAQDLQAQVTAKNFERVETRLARVETSIQSLQEETKQLRIDVKLLTEDVEGLRVDMVQLGIDHDIMKSEIKKIVQLEKAP